MHLQEVGTLGRRLERLIEATTVCPHPPHYKETTDDVCGSITLSPVCIVCLADAMNREDEELSKLLGSKSGWTPKQRTVADLWCSAKDISSEPGFRDLGERLLGVLSEFIADQKLPSEPTTTSVTDQPSTLERLTEELKDIQRQRAKHDSPGLRETQRRLHREVSKLKMQPPAAK